MISKENPELKLIDSKMPTVRQSSNATFRNVFYANPISGQVEGPLDFYSVDNIIQVKGKAKRTMGLDIDCTGLYVIPSIFNTHCHLQLNMPSLVADLSDIRAMKKHRNRQQLQVLTDLRNLGILNVRDAICEDLRGNRELAHRFSLLPFGKVNIYNSVVVSMFGSCWTPERSFGDRVLHSVAGMDFIPYDDSNSGAVVFPPDADESTVRKAVDRAVDERGADFIKVYEQRHHKVFFKPGAPLMSLKQLDALCDQTHKRAKKTVFHMFSAECFRRALTAGADSISHLPLDEILTEEDLSKIHKEVVFEPTISLALDLSWRRRGSQINESPELAQLDSFRRETMPDLIDSFWVDGLKNAVKKGYDKASSANFKLFGLKNLSAPFEYHEKIITTGVANLKKLISTGAIISSGNDGGIPPITPSSLWFELKLLRMFGGLAPEEMGPFTLRCATVNGAKALGLSDSHGVLEEGYNSGMVFYRKNPLENPDVIGTSPCMVWDGQTLSRHESEE